jgi:hypothetical protein
MTEPRPVILLIEDDSQIRRFLRATPPHRITILSKR